MRIRHILLVLASIGLCIGVRAAPLAPAPSKSEALTLLSNEQFSVLDQRYGAIQQAYKDGRITDEDLRAAFRVFYAADAPLEAKYAAWVRHSPKSYAAHLARGIYFKEVGGERRGDKFANETSDAQFAGMNAAYEIAAREFAASLKLDDRPLLTYLHWITLTMGDMQQSRKLLDLAVALDPHNFIVREKYMVSLQTRWGGSVEDMQAFLEECRKAGLSAEHLRSLESQVAEDEGWTHQYQDGDKQAAVRDYLRAAELNPALSCQPCAPLSQAADLMIALQDYLGAIKAYSRILEADPSESHARAGRGFAEVRLLQLEAAREDLEPLAAGGDAYAQDLLGRLYLLPSGLRDPAKAAEWLRRAAEQGYEPSKQILPMVMRGSQP